MNSNNTPDGHYIFTKMPILCGIQQSPVASSISIKGFRESTLKTINTNTCFHYEIWDPFNIFYTYINTNELTRFNWLKCFFLIWFMHMQICACAFLSFQLSNEKCEFEHTKKYISTICVQQVKFTVNCVGGGAVDCN